MRFKDHKDVDFRVLAHRPEIRFIHANGYVATTKTLLPLEEVVALAAMAVCDPEDCPR
ncbi:MAG: hypothetical protein R2864_00345 [Syntrophotaleaceae bacterium]